MSPNATEIDILIIGAGVVGAAVAAELSRRWPQKNIVIVEGGPRIGEGVTSRNSGVIHAGIYYPPESLKARTCVRGNALLYEWAGRHRVPFKNIGKLIVAHDKKQIPTLEKTLKNALASGASGLKMLSGREIAALEPELKMEAGIFSANTGIIDPFELTRSLVDDAVGRGVVLLTSNKVLGISTLSGRGYEVRTERETIAAQVVVNAAGLNADDIAGMAGIDKYKVYPWRGDYFTLKTPVAFRHLIYPVKDPGAAGLGVHLTLDLAGRYRLGPDVEPVTAKDDFKPAEYKKDRFREAARKIFGQNADLIEIEYDTCGIRPKLRSPLDAVEKDFVIARDLPGFINLVGIESPGLTSSLAIAEEVASLV